MWNSFRIQSLLKKTRFRFGFSVNFFRGNKCKLKFLVKIRNKIKEEREKNENQRSERKKIEAEI